MNEESEAHEAQEWPSPPHVWEVEVGTVDYPLRNGWLNAEARYAHYLIHREGARKVNLKRKVRDRRRSKAARKSRARNRR